MTTVAIDIDVLNELFDNQKKLDDIFSSFFDDDSILSSSVSYSDHAIGNSGQQGSEDIISYEDYSFDSGDNIFAEKKSSIFTIIMPVVVEIIVVSYCISYFS
jgi:hypothetical protein